MLHPGAQPGRERRSEYRKQIDEAHPGQPYGNLRDRIETEGMGGAASVPRRQRIAQAVLQKVLQRPAEKQLLGYRNQQEDSKERVSD